MGLRPEHMRALAYLLLNILSGTGIVFANKLVLSVLNFHFVRPRRLRRACQCTLLTSACFFKPRPHTFERFFGQAHAAAPSGVCADVVAQRGDHVWDVDVRCRRYV